MSRTIDGAEIARLILYRGATASQVAEMDLETLTQTVANGRKRKVAPGAIDPALTDEQLARAILEYAKSEPADWPVPPAGIYPRRCAQQLILCVWWAVIGLVGYLTGLVLAVAAGDYGVEVTCVAIVSLFTVPVLGIGGGVVAGLLAHRRLQRAGHKRAIALATVCTAVIVVVLGIGTVLFAVANC